MLLGGGLRFPSAFLVIIVIARGESISLIISFSLRLFLLCFYFLSIFFTLLSALLFVIFFYSLLLIFTFLLGGTLC